MTWSLQDQCVALSAAQDIAFKLGELHDRTRAMEFVVVADAVSAAMRIAFDNVRLIKADIEEHTRE